MNRWFVCLLALTVVASGCGGKKTKIAVPAPGSRAARSAAIAPPAGTVERGVASWYGHPYHGRQAADGEIYDMETMVAAHRTLPFQTLVRVKNLGNDKTVDVRIIDRGPFVEGRIIDLSHAAAKEIDLIGPGFGPVEITILSAPPNAEPAVFAVQIGAFHEKANADRAEQNMIAAYGAAKAVLRNGDRPVWRILAGRETSPEAAEALAIRIRAEQHEPQAFVVRLDP
ncbi:MAG: septal ring lytic transglycosylase RlpA family protein [Acidobacteriota bacterium]|nr:septal ring lytic transglycosylase RlpA family protein [Acidobacteriota bacterium]